MARGTQVSKMGKRKRKSTWGTNAKKRSNRVYNSVRGLSVRRQDFGFPDQFRTKVKYADEYTLSSGAGTIAGQVMHMNGLFDPDLSGVGHQPMWYDQCCGAQGSAPYSRYRVVGSTIKVTFGNFTAPSTAAGINAPMLVGVICTKASSLYPPTTSALLETNNNNVKVLGDKSGGKDQVVVYNRYNPRIDFGIDPQDQDLSGPYNGSPTTGFFAHVFKLDNNATVSIVKAYVEIVYDVVFYARNEVAQS